MIDLYTWGTPNGKKVSVMLEEVGLDYTVHPVHIGKGEQHEPDFTRISPNGKIPAIVDHDAPGDAPLALFESGAILTYLADKTGKFLSQEPRERAHTLQWLMWQMGGVGPMFGQMNHFRKFAPENLPYAIERYTNESLRLLGVMDHRLSQSEYLGAEYSVADIATYPWVLSGKTFVGLDYEPFPHVERWLKQVGERDAVERGMQVPS
jgi:GST-like protein